MCGVLYVIPGTLVNEAGVGGSFATPSRAGVVLINMTSRTELGKTKSNFCSSVLAPLCCMTRGQVLAAAALRYYFAGVFYRGCTAELRTPELHHALPSARRVEFAY